MSIIFERNDISKVKADVIVNLAEKTLRIGHGVDAAICYGAGAAKVLSERNRSFKILELKDVCCTKAYNLDAKFIFHIIDPVKYDYAYTQNTDPIKKCYERCLEKAVNENLTSIAFPIIGAGRQKINDFLAVELAYAACEKFLKDNETPIEIILVFFGDKITDFVRAMGYKLKIVTDRKKEKKLVNKQYATLKNSIPPISTEEPVEVGELSPSAYDNYYDKFFATFDKFYSRFEDDDINDAEICRRANLNKSMFSGLKKKDSRRIPQKNNIIALMFGLQLSVKDGMELLESAGYIVDTENIKLDNIIFHYLARGTKANELNDYFDENDINEIIGVKIKVESEENNSKQKNIQKKPMMR